MNQETPIKIKQNKREDFEYIGGDPSVDFVNTISGRNGENPRESLYTYERLVEWARGAGLFDDGQASVLLQEAEKQPQAAEEALKNARVLRESLYRIFYKAARRLPVEPGDLSPLNQELKRGQKNQRIHLGNDGYHWGWEFPREELNAVLGPVARSAAELLVSGSLDLLKVCDGDDCGWLFVDRSKNHSRRWCTMKDCGNIEKVRKYRGKKKTE